MLTARQKAFIAAYSGNASEAARQAGYSPKWADKFGPNLIGKNREIAAAIREREEKRVNSLILSREQRQVFWSTVVQDEDADMRDRLKASELLGRSEGDFLEKTLDVTPPAPPSIIVNFVDAADRQPASEG